ncbi:GlxA family transcriptional regulator [Sphaerisporangium perillae]|uniref:GlxA family transcriptional regulator n=1 Tax=Sphaerisporangium perillae TaxID=2935860 RepID=UPI00200F4B39|nr:helix-turn-helix domain-containing protein [Sphaerisporangium perillae]
MRYIPAMRTVAALVYDDMRAFDYAVIAEVWGMDRTDSGVPPFELRRCSVDGRPVRMHPGALVEATHTLDGLAGADLIVAPGREQPCAPVPDEIIEALRAARTSGKTIASLCSGAFVLAKAGLLDGRRAVTHWLLTERLAGDHPDITVVPDVLFMEDDGVWTAAGTVGGVDLCLELVRRAHGAAVANAIARRMVTAAHRDGGQAQFVERPVPEPTGARSSVAATLEWARARLDRPLTVTDLARHARTAPRTFARTFVALTGTTPAQWLIRQRITEAQRLLETTDLSVEQVATRCGFGTATMLRRHFTRLVGTAPAHYRRTFAHA